MFLEVVGLVAGLDPGFKGRGGGARSGSELSHLKVRKYACQSHRRLWLVHVSAYIGTEARPESETEG